MTSELTSELLLRAYGAGLFPMGHPEHDAVYWYAPDPRAVLPLEAFHVPKSLAKRVRQGRFAVTSDRDFEGVIRGCADRETTWITADIVAAYTALYRRGHAHSVECWQEGRLVGGLYGVALGGAFFGESMFHHATDASKVALVHLVRQMRRGGFTLLDVQYSTPHLERFGVAEVPRPEYERRLDEARAVQATWWPAAAEKT